MKWNATSAKKLQAIFHAKAREAFGSRPDKTEEENHEDWHDYVRSLGAKILVKDEIYAIRWQRKFEELKSLINGANGKWVCVDDYSNFFLVDRGFAEKVLVLGLP